MINFRGLIIILLILCSLNVYAQKLKINKLIGVWQVNTPQESDAWLANYRFFKDGTFKYTFNQYDDRGRIIVAKGNYKLKGDTLFLVIKTRMERVGGDLTGGSQGFQSEELVLEGDKIIEVKQKSQEPIILFIEWFKTGKKGFKLQNNKYYLISTDPHKEEK